MNSLVMETDIGRDADDLFALLYFLGIGAPLRAVLISPGDHDQVAVVKTLLKHFGKDIPVLTPAARQTKNSITPFHKWVVAQLGGSLDAKPDGHEDKLPTDPVDVFVCGPSKMAHLLKPLSITFQGGFVPYAIHRPAVTLDKFENKTTCATFNLGGTKPAVSNALIDAAVPHKWIGKNVCHTVVYTPEIHAKFCPTASPGEPEALRLHRLFVEKYMSEKGAKAFHDPLAAVMHYHPEIGLWRSVKPERIKGEYTAVNADNHQSLVDLVEQPWPQFIRGLKGEK